MDDNSGDDDTVRWDDRGEEMNQEEADQDVVDEVSEEVDSRFCSYDYWLFICKKTDTA